MFAVLELARQAPEGKNSAWYLVTALFIAPFLLLSPLNGALSNALPKRFVLAGTAASSLVVLAALCSVVPDASALMMALVLVAVGSAIFNPTRYALLPAAAEDTGLPLTRVNGYMELGASLGIIGGVIVALTLDGVVWLGSSAALMLALLLNLLVLLTAGAAYFPADVRRPETPLRAMRGFFQDMGRVWRVPQARGSLLGLALFLGLITTGSGALVMHALGAEAAGLPIQAMMLVSIGAALGSWLGGRPRDSHGSLGLVPVGAFGLLLALSWAATSPATTDLPLLPCLLLGLMGGIANVPLRAAFQAAVPADARGNSMAITNLFVYSLTTLLALAMLLFTHLGWLTTPVQQLALLAILSGAGTLAAGWLLRKEMVALVAYPWQAYEAWRSARAAAAESTPSAAKAPVVLVDRLATPVPMRDATADSG